MTCSALSASLGGAWLRQEEAAQPEHACPVVPEDGLPVAVLDVVDQGRPDVTAAVDEHRVGGGHPQHRRFAGPERHREQGRQVVLDAEAPRVIGYKRHPDVPRQPHRHHVLGALQSHAERGRTVVAAVVVARRPRCPTRTLVDGQRRIENEAGGRVAAVQGRCIDDGLERGAGLAPGLGDAVELVLAEREAAHHGADASGVRLERDQGAGDLGNLPQPVLGRRLLDRLDMDDVADAQDVAHAALARPPDALARDPSGAACGLNGSSQIPVRPQADAGTLGIDREHHGLLPRADVRERRQFGESARPSRPRRRSRRVSVPRQPRASSKRTSPSTRLLRAAACIFGSRVVRTDRPPS